MHKTKAEINKSYLKQNQFVIENLEYNKALLVAKNAQIKSEVAEIERLKKERLEGSLVPITEVQELFLQISSQVKAQFLRFISILPPKLEGLESHKMIPIIREEVNAILLNMSNALIVNEPVEEIEAEVITEDEEEENP
jgi:hypothetical protein